jgi:hypothetical protein
MFPHKACPAASPVRQQQTAVQTQYNTRRVHHENQIKLFHARSYGRAHTKMRNDRLRKMCRMPACRPSISESTKQCYVQLPITAVRGLRHLSACLAAAHWLGGKQSALSTSCTRPGALTL